MEKVSTILSGVRILCVDDNKDILMLLETIFSVSGAKVTKCLSAEAAITQLHLHVFDVIVSDLSMPPGLDGYDLAHALRDMQRNEESPTPAMALSADAHQESPKKRFGDFQVYLSKPFDRKRLVDIVKRLADADGEAVKAGSLSQYETDLATVENPKENI